VCFFRSFSYKCTSRKHYSNRNSLCLPKWRSGISISPSSTKESQSFTKDSKCYIFQINFLGVFRRGGEVYLFHKVSQRSHKVSQRIPQTTFSTLIFFVFSAVAEWFSYSTIIPLSSTKEPQSFTKEPQSFTKDCTCNIFLLNFLCVFCDIFSLCFLWCSYFTKEPQSFTKDSTNYIFHINFLCVFRRGGVV